MAYSFTPELPVLNFSPRAHVRPARREYLLWPAWAYRVVAPRVRDRQLNMFQRAVLGLCRAGVVEVEKIGEKLAIHSDLAVFILFELMNLGYVAADGLPTQPGLRILDEDVIEAQDMVAGYVFQDPWNGDLWPRFVERLDYCELEYAENGFPRLLLGSTGKPWRQTAFMVSPSDAFEVSQPSPLSVIAAVSGHRKGLRHADNLTDWDEGVNPSGFAPSAVHIDRVSFVEEAPKAVFLVTYLYLAEGSAEGADWYVCDPFGFGAGVRLRRRVEQVMQTSQSLYNVVDRLVSRGVHDGLEEQKHWVEQLRARAALQVERRLTLNVRTHDAFEQIVNMEFAHQEVSQLSAACPGMKLQVALRECVKVLESLFAAMAREYPLGAAKDRVYVSRIEPRNGYRCIVPVLDKALLAATYRSAALAVGFTEPIPRAMLNVPAGQIQSVALYQQYWRLRPLVMATILAAQLDGEHPLRRAARQAPQLLCEIDDVASEGGKAGHANDQPPTADDVERTVERTYAVVGVLTGLIVAEERVAEREGEVRHE